MVVLMLVSFFISSPAFCPLIIKRTAIPTNLPTNQQSFG
jgi:hypothetical protein